MWKRVWLARLVIADGENTTPIYKKKPVRLGRCGFYGPVPDNLSYFHHTGLVAQVDMYLFPFCTPCVCVLIEPKTEACQSFEGVTTMMGFFQ